MGDIRDSAEQSFRDYAADGIPSTGEHEPVKSDIRATFGVVEDKVDAATALAGTGRQPKTTVRVLTTVAVDPATGMENGDTIDGVVVATGDRIARATAAGAAADGIYVVVASGAASRATDMDTQGELLGAFFAVDAGTHAGEEWSLETTGTITVGTTPLKFIRTSTNTAVAAEVIAARGGEASLDARLDAMDTETATKAPLVWDDGTELAEASTDAFWRITDQNETDVIKGQDGDIHIAFAGASAEFGWLAELDRQNVARAHHIQNRAHNVKINPLTATYQALVGYGQSLMFGQQAWPPLSVTAISNTWMIGGSDRGYGSSWTRIGAAALNPLVATVTATADTTTVLSQAQWEALVEPDDAYGESPLIGFARGIARAWNQKGYLPTRQWVAINAADPGDPWDGLVKGQPLYNRLEDSIDDEYAPLASGGHVGCVWLWGGQYNYSTSTWGGTEDEAGCLALLVDLYGDLNADINTWLGQSLPSPWLITVPGGQYARDDGEFGIANASLKFALQTPGVWCTGPDYHVPDKAGHLDPNGSRQIGEKASQIFKHVVIEGRDWQPTHPIWMLELNDRLYVGFHAPALPLQFKTPLSAANSFHGYNEITSQLETSKGFTLIDDTGTMTLKADPWILGASILVFEYSRPRNGTMYLWAGKYLSLHEGMTMVCDSDETRSDEVYEFVDPPMEAQQNVAELVDQPYEMQNWLVPGRWQCPTTTGVQTWIDYGA